jgi:phosphoribosylaminoimidazole carboxylase PurE protein
VTSPRVGIALGSESDLPVMKGCVELLRRLEVPFDLEVVSAHRTPERAREYARTAAERGLRVLIAAAGGAAHLAGVLAAGTDLPVIGVPLDSSPLSGVDALYSTVQMPAGVPVATVAVGEFGAKNAAVLAARILALSDPAVGERLRRFRREMEESVAKANARARKEVGL